MDDTFLLDDLLEGALTPVVGGGDDAMLSANFILDDAMLQLPVVTASEDNGFMNPVFDAARNDAFSQLPLYTRPVQMRPAVPPMAPAQAAAAAAETSRAMAKRRRKMRRKTLNAARKPAVKAVAAPAAGSAVTPKEMERKRRNRESAALSRKRKRQYTNQLESEIAELTRQNAQLAGYVSELSSNNEELKKQLSALEKLVAPSADEQADLEAEVAAEVAKAKAAMASAGDFSMVGAGMPMAAAPAPAPPMLQHLMDAKLGMSVSAPLTIAPRTQAEVASS